MDQLNSIIVEGTLLEDPITAGYSEKQGAGCHFKMESTRSFKQDKLAHVERSQFGIQASGRTAESCIKHLKISRIIRVVGRLKEKSSDDPEDLPSIYIVAEHIEFKPAKSDHQS